MAKVLINETSLSGIADAIRAKNGSSDTYKPSEMAAAIEAIEAGGGADLPEEAFTITGDCSYRFAYDGWDWFIEQYGDKITTKDIKNTYYMFRNYSRNNIPFDINVTGNCNLSYMFFNAKELTVAPQLNYSSLKQHLVVEKLFNSCWRLREVPEWVGDLLEADYALGTSNTNWAPWGGMFEQCYSLKEIPAKVIQYMKNPKLSGSYYGLAYSNPFANCTCLSELKNMFPDDCALTSNQWSNWFVSLGRLKDFTFAVNEDGAPYTRQWKSQTLDISRSVGYASSPSSFTGYNSGITVDKQVKDDVTYQALKNDPDWFTCNIAYSRYNHDSAVATINSLPDTSAYGTNTIKFKGAAGSATDGGAINTLTDAEIAVAAAKGWTVTLV